MVGVGGGGFDCRFQMCHLFAELNSCLNQLITSWIRDI